MSYPLYSSNNFIEQSKKDKINDLTPMKLQKLLYFLNIEFYKIVGENLFSEFFQPWKYGPVLTSVYHQFKHYNANNITNFYESENGKYRILSKKDKYFNLAFNNTWKKYHNFSGIELSELTHKPGTPWHKAFINKQLYIDTDDIVNYYIHNKNIMDCSDIKRTDELGDHYE